MHSALSDRARHLIWQRAARGELRILIGTRSAIFTPMPDLGLIIVDEEHDASFKQQEGFVTRHATLLFTELSKRTSPCCLDPATPSTESLAHALSGRYATWSSNNELVSHDRQPEN